MGIQQAAKAHSVGLITAWPWVRAGVIGGHWACANGEGHLENVGSKKGDTKR